MKIAVKEEGEKKKERVWKGKKKRKEGRKEEKEEE